MEIHSAIQRVGASQWRDSYCEPDPAVHIVDDDASFRGSMLRMLRVAGFDARGYGCAGEFLLSAESAPCGCILLDIAMPGPSGLDLMRALQTRDSSPPVIFLTARDDVLTSVDVMKRGALDYIVKPPTTEKVIALVRNALEIDAARRMNRARLRDIRGRFEMLTITERTIFFGILRDRLNKQLAVDLGTCERTIKAQRARMMKKLKVQSVPELVRVAKLLEVAQGGPIQA